MDQLIERVAKAPVGVKVAAVAVTVLLATVLNYFVVSPTFGPSISEVNERLVRADRELKKLEAEFGEKTQIANNLNQFRREKELLEQQLREALAELPEEKNIDELLVLFQDRAQKSGLEIATIEPKAPVNERFYARLPIPMSVSGNFHEIATFFDALGRMRRIVNVTDIVLDAPKDVNGKMILSAKFLATAFMFIDPSTAPAPKAGGAKR
jgi:type IV pilus assembly protein PilO